MSVSKNMMVVKGFAQAWSTEKYLFSYFYNEDAQRWIAQQTFFKGVIATCSISTQHFAHCPAMNYCEAKSVTKDTVSILEDSYATYIESPKAESN